MRTGPGTVETRKATCDPEKSGRHQGLCPHSCTGFGFLALPAAKGGSDSAPLPSALPPALAWHLWIPDCPERKISCPGLGTRVWGPVLRQPVMCSPQPYSHDLPSLRFWPSRDAAKPGRPQDSSPPSSLLATALASFLFRGGSLQPFCLSYPAAVASLKPWGQSTLSPDTLPSRLTPLLSATQLSRWREQT